MQHKNQFRHHTRRPNHLNQNYFDAGLAAGAAAFSSLAGVLFAGFFSSFLTTGAGVVAAGAVAAGAGALAGSAAKADTANTVARIAIAFFILSSFEVNEICLKLKHLFCGKAHFVFHHSLNISNHMM